MRKRDDEGLSGLGERRELLAEARRMLRSIHPTAEGRELLQWIIAGAMLLVGLALIGWVFWSVIAGW